MKIAIIHNHPIHYKHLLFQEMKKRGCEFEVVFLAAGSDVRHERIQLSPDLYKCRVAFNGPYEESPAFTRMMFTWKAVCDIQPDVMIISSYYKIECWMAWLWARLHRRPIVMWYESNEFDYPRHWPKEILKKIFIRALSAAHVYGASNKAYLIKLGMRPEAIVLKRAVVNVEKFSQIPPSRTYTSPPNRRLIYVGRLAAEKNVEFLLRALAKANAVLGNTMSLTIVGTGPLEEDLRKVCSSLGIRKLVEFTGYCPQDSLPALLLKADCSILPSVREPWGLVPLEAMLCRVPVLISTQCGCAADLITPNTGWAFSPWDEEQLAQLLVDVAGISVERLKEMGVVARTMALEYSAPLCAERVIHSVSELLPRGNDRLPVTQGVAE